MTGAITFDAGALIAIERRSRRMQALLEEIDWRDWRVAVPAGARCSGMAGGPRRGRIAAVSATSAQKSYLWTTRRPAP